MTSITSIAPKIPETAVGSQMDRIVSVPSNRNIHDPLEVVHFDQSDRPDRTSPFKFFTLVCFPTFLSFFIKGIMKGNKNDLSHSFWLARFGKTMWVPRTMKAPRGPYELFTQLPAIFACVYFDKLLTATDD